MQVLYTLPAKLRQKAEMVERFDKGAAIAYRDAADYVEVELQQNTSVPTDNLKTSAAARVQPAPDQHENVHSVTASATLSLDTDAVTIDPDTLYRADQASQFLQIHRDSLYRMPDHVLKRTRLGPKKGSTRWLGRRLIAYMETGRGVD